MIKISESRRGLSGFAAVEKSGVGGDAFYEEVKEDEMGKSEPGLVF